MKMNISKHSKRLKPVPNRRKMPRKSMSHNKKSSRLKLASVGTTELIFRIKLITKPRSKKRQCPQNRANSL